MAEQGEVDVAAQVATCSAREEVAKDGREKLGDTRISSPADDELHRAESDNHSAVVAGHTRLDLAADGRGVERDRSIRASRLAWEATLRRSAPGEAAGQWRRSGARSTTSAHSGSWVSHVLYEMGMRLCKYTKLGGNYTKLAIILCEGTTYTKAVGTSF
jgi:hypothetical protein